MRTLHPEHSNRRRFTLAGTATGPDLEAHIEQFIERYYNRRRLHSALDYQTPEDFERNLLEAPAAAQAGNMSFFRHDGIYRPDDPTQKWEES